MLELELANKDNKLPHDPECFYVLCMYVHTYICSYMCIYNASLSCYDMKDYFIDMK